MSSANILLLYKKSAYKIYFMGKKSSVFQKEHLLKTVEVRAFKRSHEAHYQSLAAVEKALIRNGVRYHKRCRGGRVDYAKYDAVITVGGDGTFLEAARGLTTQVILGVNSDPQNSVGRFCSTNALDFEEALNRFLSGNYKVKTFQRLRVTVESAAQKYEFNVLNDLLVCQQNPAALSRYYLMVNGLKEDQRSSGIWIATAAGSSGAIHSAGARILPDESKVIQYQPRELYAGGDRHYHLKGGAFFLKQPIRVTSLMRSGTVYFDGAHLKLPFNFGARLKVSYSKSPLKVVSFQPLRKVNRSEGRKMVRRCSPLPSNHPERSRGVADKLSPLQRSSLSQGLGNEINPPEAIFW